MWSPNADRFGPVEVTSGHPPTASGELCSVTGVIGSEKAPCPWFQHSCPLVAGGEKRGEAATAWPWGPRGAGGLVVHLQDERAA